jgi:hypothetical protein
MRLQTRIAINDNDKALLSTVFHLNLNRYYLCPQSALFKYAKEIYCFVILYFYTYFSSHAHQCL